MPTQPVQTPEPVPSPGQPIPPGHDPDDPMPMEEPPDALPMPVPADPTPPPLHVTAM